MEEEEHIKKSTTQKEMKRGYNGDLQGKKRMQGHCEKIRLKREI